jgi:hypothetical protein
MSSYLLIDNATYINEATLYIGMFSDSDPGYPYHFFINGKYYAISKTSFETAVLYPENAIPVHPPTYDDYVTEHIKIMRGEVGDRLFYILENICYDISFPLVWASEHKWFSGQKHLCGPSTEDYRCGNCVAYGSVNGVFISYCSNCADMYEYHGCPRGCGVLFPEDSLDIINAKQNKVGYCENARECFAVEPSLQPRNKPSPTLYPSMINHLRINLEHLRSSRAPAFSLLPNSDDEAEPPAKKPLEFYTEFELPPEGTTVEDLYEEHHSYKWGEHRNCLAYKLDLLYQVLYIDHRETALEDPYAQFMHHRLNILDELLDTIPILKLRKIPRNDR